MKDLSRYLEDAKGNTRDGIRLRFEGNESLLLESDSIRLITEVGDIVLPVPHLAFLPGQTLSYDVELPHIDGSDLVLLEPITAIPQTPTETATETPTETPSPPSSETPAASPIPSETPSAEPPTETPSPSVTVTESADTPTSTLPIVSTDTETPLPGPVSQGGSLSIGFLAAPAINIRSIPLTGGHPSPRLAFGDLVYSTFLGGAGQDIVNGVAMDSTGKVFLVGTTASTGFPTTPGALDPQYNGQEAFVSKLDPSASGAQSLVYSTYLGGSSYDYGLGIAVDPGGNGAVFVTGHTISTDFPHSPDAAQPSLGGTYFGGGDAFVTKLNATGNGIIYSTYLGGSGDEYGGYAIAADPSGNGIAYVVSHTQSSNFPITSEAMDQTYNGVGPCGSDGCGEGAVTAINATGTQWVYSTFLGGSGYAWCRDVAADPTASGDVLLACASSSVPTSGGGFDATPGSGYMGFVGKLNSAGSAWAWVAHNGNYGGYAIAADASGAAYITGIASSGYYTTAGAFQTVFHDGNGVDGFVTKVSPNGSSIPYSTYIGGGPGYWVGQSFEGGRDIVVDSSGAAIITGQTNSPSYPVKPGALHLTGGAGILSKVKPDGSDLLYSTFLNLGTNGSGYAVAMRPSGDGDVAIGGYTEASSTDVTATAYDPTYNLAGDGFLTVLAIGPSSPAIGTNSVLSRSDTKMGAADSRGGTLSTFCCAQGSSGDPINTKTGGLDYSVSDLSILTSVGTLPFQRSYSSLATAMYAGALGYGWTSNHDIRLIFPGDPGGQSGHVLFKATSANQFDFLDNGNQTYTATPGLLAALTRNPGPPVTYTVVDPTQGVFTFNDTGKLQTWKDAQAHTWTYSYDGSSRLSRVTDGTGQRYLQLGYDAQSRVSTVADQSGRGITLGYDANGDLHTVLDVNGKTWTYTYDASHHLRLVQDPNTVTVTHTEYDAQGRAYQQYDPSGTLVLQVTYNADGTASITEFGSALTHTYDSRNTLTSETDALSHSTTKTYDNNFRPTLITDKNNHPTHLTWSTTGADLTQLIDAANGQVDLTYDSLNNLRQVTDAGRFLTTYSYNETDPDPTKRTLLNSTTDALGKTTQFTYTTTADAPQPVGLLKTITDPLTHTTSFVYDQFGQRISSTDALGKTTNYTYDSLGRLKTVEDPLHHKTWTCYDPIGRIVRSVANATGDGSSPQTDPCDKTHYVPSTDPAFDRISSTIFDDGGRVIATYDPAGVITRTYYDTDARPITVVTNLVGRDYTYPDPPDRDFSNPDQNVRTDTSYDDNGNVIATTDPLEIITRTYYDTLRRPYLVLQNFVSDSINDPAPLWDSAHPDWNVRTETFYDNQGNLIGTKDNSGSITRTYYDVLGRPATVVQNLVPPDIYVDNPPVRNPANSAQNLRTDTAYDANGNVTATTDPANVMSCTWYDALNRPIHVVNNLVPIGACGGSVPPYVSLYPDRNVVIDYYYDDSGNQIASVDTLGVVTRTYYDAANRPTLVVRHFTPANLNDPPPDYDPAHPDQNIHTQTVYDELGRTIGTIDTLGRKTRTYYEALGRPATTVSNLVGREITDPFPPPAYNSAFPDQNVQSTTTYDGKGDAIAVTDNANIVTRTYYDKVHRTKSVVRNLTGSINPDNPPPYDPAHPDWNVNSQTTYDADGSVVRTIDPVGQVTYTCYDGQRRTIKTVVNPSVSSPCGSYTPSSNADQDIIALTTYDAVGNRKTSTDPLGKVMNYAYDGVNRLASETDPLTHATSYGYDVLGNRVSMTDAKNVATSYELDAVGRLSAVVENYKPGFNPDQETNVRTEYTYDGLGNRKTIKDARTYVTNFSYDALSRLTGETDPLTHATTYGYDGVGNRTSLLDATGATTTFAFDALSRPTGIDYPAPDSDVTYSYDAAGNRHTMVDGMGTTQWAYDALNRATSITDPRSGVVGYGYDGAGHRTSLTYPDTKHVGYSYDLAGRLHIVTDWDTLQTTYTLDKASRPSTTALPNSVVSTYSFDDAGRLTGISHVRNSTTLASYTYGLDEVGNRSSVTETIRQPAVSATQLWISDTGNNRQSLFDIATITNGENAVDLLGQFDVSGSILYTKNGANDGPNVRGLNTPYDSIVDAANHRLFVSDTSNNRVLMFNLDASNQLVDRVADAVLGQANLISRAASLTASGMNTPRGLALDAGTNRLFVADTGYHRILVYDVASVTNGEAAISVLGQTGFTSGSSGLAQNRLNGPRGLGLSGSLLFVGDTTNNRILVFDVAAITNGENAVHVLGQATFTTNAAATTQTGLSSPRGVVVGASNRLFIADTTNNRVLVFDITTITDGEAAINVLGQPDFVTAAAATTQTGLRAPEDVVTDGSNRLFVGDSSNHRVMVFDVATVTNGEAAINVLGQTSFTAGSSATSQSRLYTPLGVSVQGSLLYVSDSNNHRLMVFDVASITNGENAVNLAGQVDGSLSPGYAKNGPNDGPNLLGFNISGAFASQVIDPTNHRLFASDTTNHRVLAFNLDSNNQLLDRTPDAVLGQTDFYSRTAAAAQNRFNSPRGLALDTTTNRLFVADYSNSRVLVFDVATITNGENAINVLGQTTFTAGSGATAQNRLKNPAGLALDASRNWLFVGDYNNNRVMIFDVASITNGENAINVLGQANFTTATAATSQAGLRYPNGVTVDGGSGRLFVADTNNHRVILFDVATITNGENAVNVLGQPDFVTATAATTQAGMRNPQGVALDPASNRLFVTDTNNHRATVFDVATVTNGENAVNVLGQANFTSGSSATTQSRMSSPIGILPVATATAATTTITYGYDPLYRLKAADYNTGPFFHYTYDATGNRLTQVTQAGTNNYTYDNTNRLISVDGVTYTWDNNGNLLSDGATTYTYDHANRLATATQGSNNYAFAYNGQGNRLRQTVNGTPVNYTVDINTELAVVLADGTNSYLYGPAVGSIQGAGIGEKQTGGWRYHLGDALASVRQLVDPAGSVTLAQSYEPFGSTTSTAGGASTLFQFTGEQRDATGLIYLRARFYSSSTARFITRDMWQGDPAAPMSYNTWSYLSGDPINSTDPAGLREDPGGCEVLGNPTERHECLTEQYFANRTSASQRPPDTSWQGPANPGSLAGIVKPPDVPSGAQFYVTGYKAWWDANGEGHLNELCGQLAVAAALGLRADEAVRSYIDYATRRGIWDETEGTLAEWLSGFINEKYGPIWSAVSSAQSDVTPEWLMSQMSFKRYVIAHVQISTGSRWSSHGGDVVSGGAVDHWVTITGISSQWRRPETSISNIVRIYNPFTNLTEYYPWLRIVRHGGNDVPTGFKEAWRLAGNDATYLTVLVRRMSGRELE